MSFLLSLLVSFLFQMPSAHGASIVFGNLEHLQSPLLDDCDYSPTREAVQVPEIQIAEAIADAAFGTPEGHPKLELWALMAFSRSGENQIKDIYYSKEPNYTYSFYIVLTENFSLAGQTGLGAAADEKVYKAITLKRTLWNAYVDVVKEADFNKLDLSKLQKLSIPGQFIVKTLFDGVTSFTPVISRGFYSGRSRIPKIEIDQAWGGKTKLIFHTADEGGDGFYMGTGKTITLEQDVSKNKITALQSVFTPGCSH